jgi:hypothetical protein
MLPDYDHVVLRYYYRFATFKDYYEVKSVSEMDEELTDILLEIQQNHLN